MVAVKRDKVGAHYDLFMHLDPSACNYVTHGAVHYWEQGVSKLAPGTYSALVGMFRALQEFREKFLRKNPAWFRKDAEPMSFEEVVGTYEKPGILFNMTMIKEADQRVKEEIRALRQHRLPFMPGFWDLCPLKG